MTLYSASEIVQKLKGVTTRQILDLAEKGLIKPARETTGPGAPRLYSKENIFDICICLALRGRLPAHGFTVENLSWLLEAIRNEIPKGNLHFISVSATIDEEKNDFDF